MSRNKDIDFLHNITGDPYSVCRGKLKAVSWDLTRAIFSTYYPTSYQLLEPLTKAVEDISNAFIKFSITVGDAVRQIDFSGIIDAYRQAERDERRFNRGQ